MSDYGFMGRSNGTGTKLINDANSNDGWNKRGYFSKVEARHENLHGTSDGRGMRESLANQHQSLFGKVAKKAAKDTYRPSRQNSLHTREYVFGSIPIPEPYVDMYEGWAKPRHSKGALPPEVPLSKVANDIQEAANFLRGSARPPSAANAFRSDQKSSAYSPSMYEGRRESATTRIIDSKEAKKAAQDTYRPSRQNSLHTREYVFGSMPITEPYADMSDAWTKPSHSNWAMPPEVPLSKVTNDIGEATNYLRGSARPLSATSAFRSDHSSAYSPSMYEGRKESATTQIIDSKEAAWKYGGQSATTPVMDSKEAAWKYGGQFIW